MSILVNKASKVIIQGFTGQHATFHAEEALKVGTNIVGGVTPGKGGMTHLDRPVFHTVQQAVEATGADVSGIFVPPAFAADAIMEAIDAGIRVIVVIADGVPVQDMMRVKRYLIGHDAVIIGPNTAGVITPGQCKVGIMPAHIYQPGPVGVVSRSGTLNYEAVEQMNALGLGQSTGAEHRWRPHQRLRLHHCLEGVRKGPGNQGGAVDRRNRRCPGGGGGQVGQGEHVQTVGRLYRRRIGTARAAHGPRGCHHLR